MRISGQFQACLFIYLFICFFLRKGFERKKTLTSKNKPTKQKQANRKRTNAIFFIRAKTSKRVEVVCFACWSFFGTQNLFVKKK